jgi:UDP-N-acetylmuramate--alanine ligase
VNHVDDERYRTSLPTVRWAGQLEPSTDRALAEAVRRHGHKDVTYVEKRADVAAALLPRLRPGDLVLTLGAGDVTHVGPELLKLLEPDRGSLTTH